MNDEELRAEIAQLRQRVVELEKIVSEQGKLIAFLISPYIPSSKKLIKEKKEEIKQGPPKKRGHQKGMRAPRKQKKSIFLIADVRRAEKSLPQLRQNCQRKVTSGQI